MGDGEWQNGEMHGYGQLNRSCGDTYEGDWFRGLRHGQGTESLGGDSREVYEGGWSDGMRHGQGLLKYSNRDKFEGIFHNGKRWDGLIHNAKGGVIMVKDGSICSWPNSGNSSKDLSAQLKPCLMCI